MKTLHGSLVNGAKDTGNIMDTVRLSCDVRYQPKSQRFDDRYSVDGRDNDGEIIHKPYHLGGQPEPLRYAQKGSGRPTRSMYEAKKRWGLLLSE